MSKFERINYQMDAGESSRFRQLKAELGIKTNTEMFRVLLKAYEDGGKKYE